MTQGGREDSSMLATTEAKTAANGSLRSNLSRFLNVKVEPRRLNRVQGQYILLWPLLLHALGKGQDVKG